MRPPGTCLRSIRVVISTARPGLRSGALLQALMWLDRGEIDQADVVAAYAQVLTGTMEPLVTALTAAVIAAARPGADTRDLDSLTTGVLGAFPPFHFAPRVAGQDFHIAGASIRKGQRVVLTLLAENLDAAAACAGHGRAGTGEHASFGYGTHYCLGAVLSRSIMVAVMDQVTQAGLAVRVDLGGVRHRPAFGAGGFLAVSFRGLERA